MMELKSVSNRKHVVVTLLLFFLTFLVYWRSQNTFLSDSMWAVHTSSSIINSGNIDLDEFEQVVKDWDFYAVMSHRVDGHILPYFPVGNSIIIIPVVWVLEKIKQVSEQPSFYQYLQQNSPFDPYLLSIQHFTATLITALVVPILYYIGYKKFNFSVSIMSVLIFAFGTSAYSTASRVLWQHGPSMLMLAIAMALFIKAESNPRAIQWAGLPLAFSFIIRPTNSIPIVVLTLVVFLRYRKYFYGYILGAMVIAILFVGSSFNYFNNFLPPYYRPQRIGSSPYFLEALVGNLISPARGLFVYSPVLLFALYGIFTRLWRKRFTYLDATFAIIIGLHWVMISTFTHWWGGYSYGYRLFTDMVPFLIYFLQMGLYELNLGVTPIRFRRIGLSIFLVLASISIIIHYIGANQKAIFSWSRWPVELESHAAIRLWDWTDLVFLRTVDDWPFTNLPERISFSLETNQPDELFHVPMRNTANNDYYWEIKLPYSMQIVQTSGIDFSRSESGILTVVGTAALTSGEYQWLPIKLENSLDSFTDPSMGAIMITARTDTGEERSVQVIPVSIVGTGLDWRESHALNKKVWLPSDIQVNGGKADYRLYGLFGAGWYPLEFSEPYDWRWAQSPSELYLFSAESDSLIMEISLGSLYDENSSVLGDEGKLNISVGDEIWTGVVNRGVVQSVPLTLDKGWNTVVFNLESGNFRPSDLDEVSQDKRLLSFSLDSLNLITND